MQLWHDVAALPDATARRQVGVGRLAHVIRVVMPRLPWVEHLLRPRWSSLFQIIRRLTGPACLVSPVPFSHVVPTLVTMLLALAYLEGDSMP